MRFKTTHELFKKESRWALFPASSPRQLLQRAVDKLFSISKLFTSDKSLPPLRIFFALNCNLRLSHAFQHFSNRPSMEPPLPRSQFLAAKKTDNAGSFTPVSNSCSTQYYNWQKYVIYKSRARPIMKLRVSDDMRQWRSCTWVKGTIVPPPGVVLDTVQAISL